MTEPHAAPIRPAEQPASDPYLASRYGRSGRDVARGRRGVIVVATVLVTAGLAWIAWAGLLGGTAEFEATTQGHTVVSDSALEVRWQFTVEPGTAAQCAAEALDSTYGVVGWVIVDVPPASERSRVLSQTIRTTQRASSGLIYRCWLT